MPTTIYLTGQNNFGNRGCEALVRSTVTAVRQVLPDTRFIVPSNDLLRDAAQWPGAAADGIELVPVPSSPWWLNKWGGAVRRLPALGATPWPKLPAGGLDGRYIQRADAVLSIGGDNLSLDYGVASLAYFTAVAELALAQGKPVALWGASVGPFSRMPMVEKHMAQHLRRLSFVSVRESKSIAYLAGIGVAANVVPVVDTAFLMTAERPADERFWPSEPGEGVLALNISALIVDASRERGGRDIVAETVAFVQQVLAQTRLSVLLLPHVVPLDDSAFNNDGRVNQRLLAALGAAAGPRLGLVPASLNAPQLKAVVAGCRFLIAARTHATIAGFSSAVPTVSIAYSVKAKGINLDLFGHERYVLDTPSLSSASLWQSLQMLLADEGELKACYAQRLPGWRQSAMAGAQRLLGLLQPGT